MSVKNLLLYPSKVENTIIEKFNEIEEIRVLRNLKQKGFEVDVYTHSLLTFKNALNLVLNGGDEFIHKRFIPVTGTERCAKFLFTCFIHDIGKGRVVQNKKSLFLGHEVIGSEMGFSVSTKSGFSLEESIDISSIILYHIEPAYIAIYSRKNGTIHKKMTEQLVKLTGRNAVDTILTAYCDSFAGRIIEKSLLLRLKNFVRDLLEFVEREYGV